MTPMQIIDALDVPVWSGGEDEDYDTIGSGLEGACLIVPGAVRIYADTPVSQIDAIHEALHAVVGPPSLTDEAEAGLMALEWVVCQKLDDPYFRMWRKIFAEYGLGIDDDVGMDDEFLVTPTWRRGVAEARRAGLLTHDDRVVWGRGPYPLWWQHLPRSCRLNIPPSTSSRRVEALDERGQPEQLPLVFGRNA